MIFITISTLYTKRFWDNLLGEFKFGNLKDPEKIKKAEKEYAINKKIENIDISDIKSVKFFFNNWKSINIRAKNLIKITKLVINKFGWQTIYKKEELIDIYENIKNNYKTKLSKDNYNKIINILEIFVKEGWEIKLEKSRF